MTVLETQTYLARAELLLRVASDNERREHYASEVDRLKRLLALLQHRERETLK